MKIILSVGLQRMALPVTPKEFGYKTANKIDVVEIIGIGETSIPGNKKLKSTSINQFFPKQKYPFAYYENGFVEPMEYVDLLEQWENDGAVVLVEADGFKKIQMHISNFDYKVQDGSGDVYYSLSFLEAVASQLTKVGEITKPIDSVRIEKTVEVVEYVVKSGDTLSRIAKKLTGDSGNWKKIASENSINDPRLLQVGTKLVIT